MITLRFWRDGDIITGFEVFGHSGYADEGHDIVCASVTTAVILTECAVNDVLKLGAKVLKDDDKPSISLQLPPKSDMKAYEAGSAVLQSLYLTATMLIEEYGSYLHVILE